MALSSFFKQTEYIGEFYSTHSDISASAEKRFKGQLQ